MTAQQLLPVHQAIADKLTAECSAQHVAMIDNSHLHLGHSQNTGHHLVITIVSDDFTGKNQLQRMRAVHKVLADDMKTTIHALELKLFSPDEWTTESA